MTGWPRTPHYRLLLPQKNTIGGSGPAVGEVPAGVIDGANDTFTIVGYPAPGSLDLFVDGANQQEGVAFTISGRIITFEPGSIPTGGQALFCNYVRMGDYYDVASKIIGDQIELIPRANAASAILTARLAVGAGGLARVSGPDSADSSLWAGAQLVAANDGAANAQARFQLTGLATLAGNGTAGRWVVPASDVAAANLEGTGADQSISGPTVARRALGFGVGGAVVLQGPQPNRLQRSMQVARGLGQGFMDRGYNAMGGLVLDGSVPAAGTGGYLWPVLIPSDFGAWPAGSGEGGIAAQIRFRSRFGTVTGELSVVDTAGLLSAYGAASTDVVTVAGSVLAGGTFTPGRFIFVKLRIKGNASGGAFTMEYAPSVRYDQWLRSNV